ncbi:MAG TPA: hypothetical protein VFA09_03890 [Ktedonobacteraceae bacterium]|jgi:hypothetical protein|nr:hypothetical protein [Ktedonobacteraceae bacterium]HZU66396.1 hypothetical protein [Ktedonobacteraceae bacterium]
MHNRLKRALSKTTLATCGLLLVATLVAACSSPSRSSTSQSASTHITTPTPAYTRGALVALEGNGFKISYPPGLHVSKSDPHLVILTNGAGTIKITFTVVPDVHGKTSAASLLNAAVNAQKVPLKNVQIVPAPPTTTVGGTTWNQESVSGTQRLNATNTMMHSVVMATIHPANSPASQGYTIAYSAPQSMFNAANTTYFQPVLQSFKFQP